MQTKTNHYYLYLWKHVCLDQSFCAMFQSAKAFSAAAPGVPVIVPRQNTLSSRQPAWGNISFSFFLSKQETVSQSHAGGFLEREGLGGFLSRQAGGGTEEHAKKFAIFGIFLLCTGLRVVVAICSDKEKCHRPKPPFAWGYGFCRARMKAGLEQCANDV